MLQLLFYITVYTSIVLLLMMFFFSYLNKVKKQKYSVWEKESNELINTFIFIDNNTVLELPDDIHTLKKNPFFRTFISQKIITAVKNFSGETTRNLKQLYLLLELDKDTLHDTKHVLGHLKTRAIRNVGVMNLKNFEEIVFENTNHKNDLIRIEAQVALIRLTGFKGLKFLNIITYPISEWYQIVLLRELKTLDPEKFKGIKIWLKSFNKSVIVFTLKLIANYHLFEFYPDTVKLLHHKNHKIRLQAIRTLAKIFNKNTPKELLSIFENETTENKIAILKELSSFKEQSTIPYLIELLKQETPTLQIVIIKTIAKIDTEGILLLEKIPNAHTPPLNNIILQLKEEQAYELD
ncbi:hypothetical protein FHR24_002187 [Wenyingzhuangia heitensis]|uniref:HEAT repeat-containing protein n=1 Tax=Wenyingzhuangia heitensis TaxID=1487859 RepID=A0ABX0UE39_9FLAO|nr:HEAT repeat domain-containing protein [Wenyingzhuangia heitensis]NIJ45716.1 hypothetical protein [Wenyingzhuangia heitensis]